MKRFFFLAAVAVAVCSCDSKQPTELYIPKSTVEFAGNAFTAFSLGSDVKMYTEQNPDNKSQWMVQAVVPIRKETQAKISGLEISRIQFGRWRRAYRGLLRTRRRSQKVLLLR